MTKLILFLPTWVVTYMMLAFMVSVPFAFAFWDITILTNAVAFWQKPLGGEAFVRALSFVFSFILTCVSMSQDSF